MVKSKTEVFIMDVRPLYEKMIFLKYFKLVSPERQAKIERLKSINSKVLSLGAGLLLNEILEQCGKDRRSPIIENEKGKPFLKECDDLYFNLSHSGHFVICAISPRKIGVDIQKIKDENIKLAKRFFHEKEFKYLSDLPPKIKKNGFSHVWAAKESYIKYLGTGLSTPLNSFEIQFQMIEESWHGEVQDEKVYLKNFTGPENYVIWCCSETEDFDEKLKEYSCERSEVIEWEKE